MDPAKRVALNAARIAVLVARSCTVRRDSGALAGYALPESRAVSAEELAQTLAGMPKPVLVRAHLHDTVIVLTASTLGEHHVELQRHRLVRCHQTDEALGFLKSRMAEDGRYEELGVSCHGAGEFVHVTAGTFQAWLRDYVHGQPHAYGADFSDSPYPGGQGVDPSRLRGLGFVNFGWADDRHEVTVHVL